MPPPIRVELIPHDPDWKILAAAESQRIHDRAESIVVVHHIGSTSIPGICAKPIIDLMPVVLRLSELDGFRSTLETLGYEWWGELGLAGRRYCTRSDPEGRRLVQLHCYQEGSPEIERHLAFRDYLIERPDIAQAYEHEKRRCAERHPDNSHAYGDCKNAWINLVEAQALAAFRFSSRGHTE